MIVRFALVKYKFMKLKDMDKRRGGQTERGTNGEGEKRRGGETERGRKGEGEKGRKGESEKGRRR
jgi:hypothetical protein